MQRIFSLKIIFSTVFLFFYCLIFGVQNHMTEFMLNIKEEIIPQPQILNYEIEGEPCVVKNPEEYAEYRPSFFITDDGMKGWTIQLPEGLPLATPAYENEVLFIGGGFGSYSFYAIDAVNGEIKWAVHTGDDGPTAAVVKNGIVVFNTESCIIYALRANDGKNLWHHWLGDPLMSQPAISGRRVFMAYPGSNGHVLACFDLLTGINIWSKSIVSDIISAPVVSGDEVFLSSFDGMVYSYDVEDGQELWKKNYNASSAPWIDGDRLYTGMRQDEEITSSSGENILQRFEGFGYLEKETGEQLNETQISYITADYLNPDRTSASARQQADLDAQVGFSTAPSTANLSLAEENVGIFTVSGAWSYQGSRPVVYDSDLFSSQGNLLRRNDIQTGEKIWEFEYNDTIAFGRSLTPPVVVNGKIFVGSSSGEIFCIKAEAGEVIWSYNCKDPIVFQPIVMDGKVFWGTTTGRLFCIDTGDRQNTGWAMWGGNSEHNGWTE